MSLTLSYNEALERIIALESELRMYVTNAEDREMWEGATWHSIIVPNRRILASRKLLGLGHLADETRPLKPEMLTA